ncbi:nuclear condensing complex subunit [Polychytrium aggregatum]|uniref:nuclear condensing complex subunit n=1 Tax=Polychytrium aggregatum TaxID=110093 RepID=UPI0022FEA377|nr:nuclear condensing complex subunit [Polychytrium aggregatum]KAI9205193.1 nuclear condensing complex subunit [Polychytrium aggregatum]
MVTATEPSREASSINVLLQDSVSSTATHRKNAVRLKKLLLKPSTSVPAALESLWNAMRLVLLMKKGHPQGDRFVKFFETFMQEGDDSDEKMAEIRSKVAEFCINKLYPGLIARDRVVRFRVCQILSVLLGHLSELDDDVYVPMRNNLLQRTVDRDTNVRIQALNAVSLLQGSGDEEEEQLIREQLLQVLSSDPSGDVRRTALIKIDLDTTTLSHLLERIRDQETTVRKALLQRLAEDPDHLAMLTHAQWDTLLASGLFDRDESVKADCENLFANVWLQGQEQRLFEFLSQIDVMDPDSSAPAALTTFFKVHKDNWLKSYQESLWDNLSVERAFFLRHCITFCTENDLENELDTIRPSLTAVVEMIKKHFKAVSQDTDDESRAEQEFIISQLLVIAEHHDFSDEVGRRNLQNCFCELISMSDLERDCFLTIIKTIQHLSIDETDFTRLIIELLYQIYDQIDEKYEDSQDSSQEPGSSISDLDGKRRTYTFEDYVIIHKCLDIIRCMMECLQSGFPQTESMNGLLKNFVLPGIQSGNFALWEAGLYCLGLFCIFDESLAQENVALFIHAYNTVSKDIKLAAMKILFDLILRHGHTKFLTSDVLQVFQDAMESEDPDVLTLAVEGVAKLMMLKCTKSPELLQALVVLYFHPLTASMNRLKQCLSYFFPVFSHSNHDNQKIVSEAFFPILKTMIPVHQGNKDMMIPPLQIAHRMIEWTDVRNLAKQTPDVNRELHADIALDVITNGCYEEEVEPSALKVYCQILGKFYIPSDISKVKLNRLRVEVAKLKEIVKDSVALNALKKFTAHLIEIEVAGASATERDNDAEDAHEMMDIVRDLRSDKDAGRAASSGEESDD